MKIFFDLDGTLLHSMNRLYRLFQHMVPASKLSYDEYWDYKRNKIGHTEILKNNFAFSDEEVAAFQEKWLGLIEEEQWLLLDRPFETVTAFLAGLKKEHDIYLVTARQFEDRLLRQIQAFGWENLFTKILVTGGKREKYDLIKESIETGPGDWFAGDTGKDIQTGKKLGIKTVAVACGFLNKEKLAEYGPDMIIDNILQFKIPT